MVVAVDVLDDILEETWQAICSAYHVTADLPEMQVLFAGVDLTAPERAAEMVVVNMLTEVVEHVGRFSPWYKKPARAFGLVRLRVSAINRVQWILAPEAAERWRDRLEPLAHTIRRNTGLIEAIQLVDDVIRRSQAPQEDDSCVLVGCDCVPQRVILINQSILHSTEVICKACHHPFHPIEEG